MVDTNSIWAHTNNRTESGAAVQTGWLGAKARLYKNGKSEKESGWKYKTKPTANFSYYVNITRSAGYYYSKGISAAYNGSGYNTVATYESPTLNG